MEESSKKESNISDRGPRLYYHGSGINQAHATALMSEYGLLLKENIVATLTPFLEIAQDYLPTSKSLLTFWYPKPSEIEKPMTSVTRPMVPFPDDIRQEAIANIQSSDLEDFFKAPLLNLVKTAVAYLPPSRLGAVAVTNENQVGWLSVDLPKGDPKVLTDFAADKEQLIRRVEENLGRMDIKYFDPELNNRRLAEDIVRTTVEHYMLSLGLEIRFAQGYEPDLLAQRRPVLQRHLDRLKGVELGDTILDRYRGVLIKALSKLVGDSA